jgi:hypothetical protein
LNWNTTFSYDNNHRLPTPQDSLMTPDENLLGVEAATSVAGFVGAVASLSSIKPLSRLQALLAVFTGAAVAAYCAPLVTYYCKIEVEPVENGIAFLLGLIAMQLVPAVIFVAEVFRNNPIAFLRRILGGNDR